MPHYDQVPIGSLPWGQQAPYPLGGEVAASSYDSLPPPASPRKPSCWPRFLPEWCWRPDRWCHGHQTRSTLHSWLCEELLQSQWQPRQQEMDLSTTTTTWCEHHHRRRPVLSSTLTCTLTYSSSSYLDPYGGSGGSYNSRKEQATLLGEPLESVSGRSLQTAMTYSEKVEEYNQRYAYMKSWAGLLRILGCAELLLGAAIFACVCAYVHKDNEWFNMFGYSMHSMNGGMYGGTSMGGMYGGTGISYSGPMTPFVIVVAGVAWIVDCHSSSVRHDHGIIVTILLDSSWWPITEGVINVALALLYFSAAIVYVRDTVRGGLCILSTFQRWAQCGVLGRTEAGQNAAIIFLFFNMLLYLVGAGVCLKLWRHEACKDAPRENGSRCKVQILCCLKLININWNIMLNDSVIAVNLIKSNLLVFLFLFIFRWNQKDFRSIW